MVPGRTRIFFWFWQKCQTSSNLTYKMCFFQSKSILRWSLGRSRMMILPVFFYDFHDVIMSWWWHHDDIKMIWLWHDDHMMISWWSHDGDSKSYDMVMIRWSAMTRGEAGGGPGGGSPPGYSFSFQRPKCGLINTVNRMDRGPIQEERFVSINQCSISRISYAFDAFSS